MVPTMIGMTLAHPEFRPEGLGSFTDLVYGASPMPQALLEKLLDVPRELENVMLLDGVGHG